MTRRRNIDITVSSDAGVAAVFALLADGNTWPQWTSIQSFELERAGDPPPEGVGAIRIYRRGRTTGRDQIEKLVPDRHFGYEGLSGLPVRDYHGTVDLEPTPTGSIIRWRSSFLPKVPVTGRMLERGIRGFVAECANGLARYAAISEQAIREPS